MDSLVKSPSLIAFVCAQLKLDLRAGLRSGGGWFHAVYFFAVFASFMAFAVGPDRTQLSIVAPALIWLGAMLSLQLSATDLFASDYLDDSLKITAVEQGSLVPYIIAKLTLVTLTSSGPIILLAPLYFVIFGIDPTTALRASFVFTLGVPALILAAAVSASLSAGMRTSGLLGAGLSVPIAIPSLIFGVSSMRHVIETSTFWSPELQILCALTLIYLVVVPIFLIAALRFGLE